MQGARWSGRNANGFARTRAPCCRERPGEPHVTAAHLRHRPHPRISCALDRDGAWPRLRACPDRDHRSRREVAGIPQAHPNGRLPFIDDDGFVLFESLAITLYLAKKHANGTLYPAKLEDEAKTWQWTSWALTEVDRGVNIWSLHAVRLPVDERDAAKRDEALKVLAAPFRVLDAAVATQPYLLGGTFTVADLNVAAVISRAVDMDLSAVPSLKAWLARCLERPAARKALALKGKADRETSADVTRRIARINRL